MKKKICVLGIIFMFVLFYAVNAFAYTSKNNYYTVDISNSFDTDRKYASDTSASYYESYSPVDYGKKNVSISFHIYKSSYLKGFKSSDVESFKKSCKENNQKVIHADISKLNGFPLLRTTYSTKSTGGKEYVYDSYKILSDNYSTTISVIADANINFIDSKEENNIINSFKLKDTAKKYQSSGLPFNDVSTSAWYYNAVKYTYSNKIISGYSDTKFAPNDMLTRGMIVTILYRMENSPKNDGKSKFADVSSNQWYSKAIKWAVQKDIVHGYGGTNNFGPNDNIIRQDLAGILRNYAKYKNKNVKVSADLSKFKDVGSIGGYALPSIKWAVGKGVITGNKNGTLNPKGNATRAEAAAMIQKYCENVGK